MVNTTNAVAKKLAGYVVPVDEIGHEYHDLELVEEITVDGVAIMQVYRILPDNIRYLQENK